MSGLLNRESSDSEDDDDANNVLMPEIPALKKYENDVAARYGGAGKKSKNKNENRIIETDYTMLQSYNKSLEQTNINDFFFRGNKKKQAASNKAEGSTTTATVTEVNENNESDNDSIKSVEYNSQDCPLPAPALARPTEYQP